MGSEGLPELGLGIQRVGLPGLELGLGLVGLPRIGLRLQGVRALVARAGVTEGRCHQPRVSIGVSETPGLGLGL